MSFDRKRIHELEDRIEELMQALEELQAGYSAKGNQLATLRGRILGLADFCGSHPHLVAEQIKEMAAEIEAGVEVSAL